MVKERKRLDSQEEAKYNPNANFDLAGKNTKQLKLIRSRNIKLAIGYCDAKLFGEYYRHMYRYLDADKLLKKRESESNNERVVNE